MRAVWLLLVFAASVRPQHLPGQMTVVSEHNKGKFPINYDFYHGDDTEDRIDEWLKIGNLTKEYAAQLKQQILEATRANFYIRDPATFHYPYLTIVVVSRNDNYAEGSLLRLQQLVNSLAHGYTTTRASFEFILVEWSPVAGKQSLQEALEWPVNGPPTRVITVPAHLARSMMPPKSLPFNEFIGKNVGIRHAQGRWVLVTNSDTFFRRDFFVFLEKRLLKPDAYYRADRLDTIDIPAGLSYDETLEMCKRNVFKIHTNHGTFAPPNKTECAQYNMDPVSLFMHHYPSFNMTAIWNVSLFKTDVEMEDYLFYSASGDFLMLQKEHWTAMYGNCEAGTFESVRHFDSIAVSKAARLGLLQVTLPLSLGIFQIDHERHTQLSRRETNYDLVYQTYRGQAPEVNSPDWGLWSQRHLLSHSWVMPMPEEAPSEWAIASLSSRTKRTYSLSYLTTGDYTIPSAGYLVVYVNGVRVGMGVPPKNAIASLPNAIPGQTVPLTVDCAAFSRFLVKRGRTEESVLLAGLPSASPLVLTCVLLRVEFRE